MVPLDRALVSSYAVYSNNSAIANGLAAICNANFDWGFRSPLRYPKSPHTVGGPGALSDTERDSERIIKIGSYLPTLSQKDCVSYFILTHSVDATHNSTMRCNSIGRLPEKHNTHWLAAGVNKQNILTNYEGKREKGRNQWAYRNSQLISENSPAGSSSVSWENLCKKRLNTHWSSPIICRE